MNCEKSYILGVIKGDGYMKHTPQGSQHYLIQLQAKDKEFVEYFRNQFIKIYRIFKDIKVRTPRGNVPQIYDFTVTNKKIFFDIKTFEQGNDVCKICFLKGFYDSEGCASIHIYGVSKSGKPWFMREIILCGTDEKLFCIVKNWLMNLGIEYRTSYQKDKRLNRKKIWRLVIARHASICKFSYLIGFRIERKQKILAKMVEAFV